MPLKGFNSKHLIPVLLSWAEDMSGLSNASHQATQGSDLEYVRTSALEIALTKEMLILTKSEIQTSRYQKPSNESYSSE